MILKNIRYLVTQNEDREVHEKVDLRIEDEEITEIKAGLEKRGGEEALNCSDKAVLPGLINSHTHVSMSLLRGISDDKKLQKWLEEDIFPAEDRIDSEDVYIGALLGCLEMLKTGTTCFNDMYAEMDKVGEAVDQTGMKAVLSRGILDIDGKASERLDEARKLIDRFKNHERIETSIAPHSVYTASEETILKSKEIAEENNVPIHMHVSETKEEVKEFKQDKGLTPLEFLDNLNMVNSDLIVAHGVWLLHEERDLLEEKGGTVVHNPSANLKLGSGVADIPDLMERGINISLGTDGVASNNNHNLFEEAKLASVLHKMHEPSKISAQNILDMMTVNAAKSLGLDDEIGSISTGKKADLILIDLNREELTPIHGVEGLISNIIYSFNGKVDSVFVNGDKVIEEREHTSVKEDKIMEEASETANSLI